MIFPRRDSGQSHTRRHQAPVHSDTAKMPRGTFVVVPPIPAGEILGEIGVRSMLVVQSAAPFVRPAAPARTTGPTMSAPVVGTLASTSTCQLQVKTTTPLEGLRGCFVIPSIKSSGAPGSRDDARKALPGVSRGVRMPLLISNDCASTFARGHGCDYAPDETFDTTCYADKCAAR